MSGLSVAELDALIVEATVDCYGEDEQVLGLDSVMVEELAAGSSVAGRCTGIGWWTPDRIGIGHMRRGDVGCSAWIRIR